MKRSLVLSSSLVVLAAALLVLWKGMQSPPAPAAAAAAPSVAAAPPAPAPEPDPVPAAPAPPPAFEPIELPTDHADRVLSDPVLAERARQHELAAAADARWNEAVEGGEYRAEDLDPAVRDLFRELDLEPRYAEGGRIEGLQIQSLSVDHPLSRLGFRPGDRIDRIQGVTLSDPAELPSLLARLGPHFSLCADRNGTELCRDLALE
jgi:hypothetical protein